MSHTENTKLREVFMDTLDSVIVCPYCGEENQLDPPLLCCSEVHACSAWRDVDEEVYLESELDAAFTTWLQRRKQ